LCDINKVAVVAFPQKKKQVLLGGHFFQAAFSEREDHSLIGTILFL
jgi:hypothetical protein